MGGRNGNRTTGGSGQAGQAGTDKYWDGRRSEAGETGG